MSVAEKIRYLREVEGSLRGLGRPMTQLELVRGIRQEIGKTISQSYISQIENGSRRHITQSTRTMLARFFKVHPGFLVDDPRGVSHRADFKFAHNGRKVGRVAFAGFGTFCQRSRS